VQPGPVLRLLPHVLTFARIPLGIAFFLVFNAADLAATIAALALLLTSAATDALDGHLARRMGVVSAFGKWADPLTDALFFLFAYLAFNRAGMMPLVLLAVFLAREIAQYAVIRPLTARRGKDPGARPAGKIKTGAQIAGTALVVIFSGASAAGLIAPELLIALSTGILTVLVTTSAVSLYWYIRPLLGPGP
jgi:CDP-diacylglycerol--glycerol-3-phosphate 3-phosphatidyltransferase